MEVFASRHGRLVFVTILRAATQCVQDDVVVPRWKGWSQGAVKKCQRMWREFYLIQGFLGVIEAFILDGWHSRQVSNHAEVGVAILGHVIACQCLLLASPAAAAHAAQTGEHHHQHRTCHATQYIVQKQALRWARLLGLWGNYPTSCWFSGIRWKGISCKRRKWTIVHTIVHNDESKIHCSKDLDTRLLYPIPYYKLLNLDQTSEAASYAVHSLPF